MKLFILAVMTILGCRSLQSTMPGITYSGKFNISKIDSTGNYYLIYASRNDSTFKIISKKEIPEPGNELVVSTKVYQLTLQSAMPDIRVGKGVYSATKNLHVDCYGFDSETTICFEKGCIRDLFYAKEFRGACYFNTP